MFKPMRYLKICIAIYTDVSFEGWGFSMGHISTWRRGGGGGGRLGFEMRNRCILMFSN